MSLLLLLLLLLLLSTHIYIYIYCAGLLKHYQVYAVLPDRLCKGDSDGDSRWLK